MGSHFSLTECSQLYTYSSLICNTSLFILHALTYVSVPSSNPQAHLPTSAPQTQCWIVIALINLIGFLHFSPNLSAHLGKLLFNITPFPESDSRERCFFRETQSKMEIDLEMKNSVWTSWKPFFGITVLGWWWNGLIAEWSAGARGLDRRVWFLAPFLFDLELNSFMPQFHILKWGWKIESTSEGH